MPATAGPSLSRHRPGLARAAVSFAALGAVAVFCVFGNSARGYIHTRSLFVWWGTQWFDPAADAEWGPLIVVVAVALAVQNFFRERAAHSTNEPATRVALAIAAAGLALHVVGYAMQQTRVSIVGVLIFVHGLFGLGAGRAGLRATAVPLAFCLFAVPFGFLEPLSFYLRLTVSETTELVFRAIGRPVLRNGTQLFAADGGFQYDVAAACSGIRSIVALFALSFLLAYLQLRRTWTRIALVLATVPFAFAGNLVRIFAIVAAAQFAGAHAGERVHAASGWLVFAVVLGLALLTARTLRRRETDAAASSGSASADPRYERIPPSSALAAGIAALLVVATAVACRSIETHIATATAGVKLAENGIDPQPLPEFIGTEWIGQRVEVTPVEREILPPDTGYSRRNYVSVEDREHQVFVSFVLSGRDRTSIHRPELCLVGQGWNIVDRSSAEIPFAAGAVLPVTWLQIEKTIPSSPPRQVRAVFAYTFVGPDGVTASHADMVLRSSWDRLRALRSDRWAYLVVQTWDDADRPAVMRRLGEVLQPVWQSVSRVPAPMK